MDYGVNIPYSFLRHRASFRPSMLYLPIAWYPCQSNDEFHDSEHASIKADGVMFPYGGALYKLFV